MATVQSLMGDFDSALRHGRRAVELAPGMTIAQNGLGVALVTSNRLDEARLVLTDALRTSPRGAWRDFTQAMMGAINYLTGDYQAAANIGERLIANHPAYPHGYWVYLAALGRLGERDRARPVLAAWAAAAPGHQALFASPSRLRAFPRNQYEEIIAGIRAAGWDG
jgi:tetratricopeptide (TPR) repeat protein